MSLMAVFNCSFLITLILFLLIIGLIWIHFNQKINDQNMVIFTKKCYFLNYEKKDSFKNRQQI